MRPLLVLGVIILIALVFWKVKILIEPPDEVRVLTVDLHQQFLPWYSITASSLRDLSFPLWFPSAGVGFPWFATPSTAVLYPPNLLYLFCSPSLAMGILGQFHLILAGIGVYGFCRMHSLGRSASLLAGLAYMLNRSTWINYINPHYLAGVAWLPIVFLLGERIYQRPSIRSALLLAAAMSMQFLSGASQFFLYTTYFMVFYLAVRIFLARSRHMPPGTRLRVPILMALSVLLVVLICAIQLLPSFELLEQSVRSKKLSEDSVHFLGVYFPWWYSFLGALDAKLPFHFENLVYRGALLPVLLVMYSLFGYKDRRVHALAAVALASLLLSSGYSTPLYRLFAMMPGIGTSRQPDRIAVLAAFALAVLAGIGLQAFFKNCRDAKMRRRIMETAKLAGIGGILTLLLWKFPTNGKAVFPIAGFVILVAAACAGRPRYQTAAALCICTLVACEFGKIPSSHPQAHPEYLRDNGIEILKQLPDLVGDERIFVEERGTPPRPFPTYRVAEKGVSSVADYHPAMLSRMADIIAAIGGAQPLYPAGLIILTAETARPELLHMLSVKFLLVHANDNIFDKAESGSPMWEFTRALRHIMTYKGYTLLVNSEAMPRAYMVHLASVTDDRFSSLRATLAHSFDPSKNVVLEGEAARDILPMLSPGESYDTVNTVSRTANRVLLDVSSEKGGILVLTDAYYPGWIAEIDGIANPIYRANYLFRAVYVPSGKHMIQFSYRPRSFYAGVCLSALGLLTLGMGFVLTRGEKTFQK